MHRTITYHDIFIECCMAEIDELLDIQVVDVFPALDPNAILYKKLQLRCFFSRGSNIELRKALLVRSLPLDWRSNRIVFPVLRSVGPIPNSTVKNMVKHGVKTALFGRRCPIYNTSDWTHADLALDWIGAAEAPYRLYSRSMARFLKAMQSKKAMLCLENRSAVLLPTIEDSVPTAAGFASSEGEAKKDGDD